MKIRAAHVRMPWNDANIDYVIAARQSGTTFQKIADNLGPPFTVNAVMALCRKLSIDPIQEKSCA